MLNKIMVNINHERLFNIAIAIVFLVIGNITQHFLANY